MAASVTLKLSISETSYSIPNNTSDIRWSLSVTSSNASNGYDYQCPYEVRYDSSKGSLVASGHKGFAKNTTTQLASGTISGYKHNNNGSASITLYAHYYTDTQDWEVVPHEASTIVSINLTTIPRKTICPSLSTIVKTPTSLTISPKAANTFQHSLQIFYGNLSYYVNANGNMQSSEYKFGTNVTQIPITIPASFYSQFSGINGQGVLRLRTYNGNTYIDQSDATLYVKVNEDLCRPYISSYNYNIYDTNQKTNAITKNINDVVQYASRIQGSILNYYISDPDDTNTTITSKTIPSINYTIPSDNSILITNPTTNSFSVSLKNSRTITGQSEIKTTGKIIPYVPLTFNIESLKRPEPTTGEIELSYNGNYYAKPFIENEYGYFEVGDTMSPLNTELYIPDDFYKQMDQNAHHTIFMTGSNYVVADDTTVMPLSDGHTVIRSYNLVIYEPDTSPAVYDIPYDITVTYVDGVETRVSKSSNIRTPHLGAGLLSSVDTTNIFYPLIHNTDKDTETMRIMNELHITWQYREKGSNTWIDGGTLTPTINTQNNTYSGYTSLGTMFDYQKQYEFLFTAEDLLFNSNGDGTETNPINPIQVQEQVTRGLPIIWWSDGSVHVLGDVYVSGTVYNGNNS